MAGKSVALTGHRRSLVLRSKGCRVYFQLHSSVAARMLWAYDAEGFWQRPSSCVVLTAMLTVGALALMSQFTCKAGLNWRVVACTVAPTGREWLVGDLAPYISLTVALNNVQWRLELNCSSSWTHQVSVFYFAAVGVRSIVISLSVCVSVCLSVCRRAYLWNRWTDLHEFLCRSPVAVARSSGAVWDTLCTSGFMDDVTFVGRVAMRD